MSVGSSGHIQSRVKISLVTISDRLNHYMTIHYSRINKQLMIRKHLLYHVAHMSMLGYLDVLTLTEIEEEKLEF